MTGMIASWSPKFGFIRPDEDCPQVFFCGASCDSARQLYSLLRRGDRVSYDVAPDRVKLGRLMAVNVMWLAGYEPSATELHRRVSRQGDLEAWRRRDAA